MFELDGKYIARSRAVVIDNKDPNKRGRIRVRHPLLGDTVWINYLKASGQFDVPKIGDVVYIECDCGEDSHPIASGCIVKGKDGDLDTPEVFQRIDPTNKGLYTPGGHLIELDDGEGPTNLGKGVRVTTSGGIKIHALEGAPTESKVLVELPNGLIIEADGISDSIKASVAFGDKIELSRDNGWQVETPALGGTSLSMKAGAVDLKSAQAEIHLTAEGDTEIKGPTASVTLSKDGDINLKGPLGDATIAQDGGIEVKNATASLIITPAGQVELKGAAAGVVDLLVQAFTALSTQTAPGFGAPTSTVAQFAELLAKATALKAT